MFAGLHAGDDEADAAGVQTCLGVADAVADHVDRFDVLDLVFFDEAGDHAWFGLEVRVVCFEVGIIDGKDVFFLRCVRFVYVGTHAVAVYSCSLLFEQCDELLVDFVRSFFGESVVFLDGYACLVGDDEKLAVWYGVELLDAFDDGGYCCELFFPCVAGA